MQIGNNNTNVNTKIQTNSTAAIRPFMQAAMFFRPIYTNASKKVTAPFQQIGITDLYPPKLLLSTFACKSYIETLMINNPKVKNILEENNAEVNISPENVLSIKNTHLQTTDIIAQQIAAKIGLSQSDKQILDQAAIFHDFGKILIPKEILNKTDSLTKEEKKIIDLHAQLGYELLSASGLNKRALNIIKNHHKPQESDDILCSILSVADIYSALREERCYRKALSNEEAAAILDQKARNGEVSAEIVQVLKSLTRKAAKKEL